MPHTRRKSRAHGVYAQNVALVGAVEERILECFETGAGTAYGDYPRFHEIKAEDSAPTVTGAPVRRSLAALAGVLALLSYGRFAQRPRGEPSVFFLSQNAAHRLTRATSRPGGIYLMQDIGGSAHLENNIDFPMAALLYAISCMHCTPISLGQGGTGLGTMWGWETAQAMLHRAGFRTVERHVLPHDPMNVWFVSRKGE